MNPENIHDKVDGVLELLFNMENGPNPYTGVGKQELEEAIATMLFVLARLHKIRMDIFLEQNPQSSKDRYIKKTVELFCSILTSHLSET